MQSPRPQPPRRGASGRDPRLSGFAYPLSLVFRGITVCSFYSAARRGHNRGLLLAVSRWDEPSVWEETVSSVIAETFAGLVSAARPRFPWANRLSRRQEVGAVSSSRKESVRKTCGDRGCWQSTMNVHREMRKRCERAKLPASSCRRGRFNGTR